MKKLIWAVLLSAAFIGSPMGATPLPSNSLTQQTQGNPDVKVWVNTRSGVYHCPGTRWYGKTKEGEYMTQKQAQQKGYRPGLRQGLRHVGRSRDRSGLGIGRGRIPWCAWS